MGVEGWAKSDTRCLMILKLQICLCHWSVSHLNLDLFNVTKEKEARFESERDQQVCVCVRVYVWVSEWERGPEGKQQSQSTTGWTSGVSPCGLTSSLWFLFRGGQLVTERLACCSETELIWALCHSCSSWYTHTHTLTLSLTSAWDESEVRRSMVHDNTAHCSLLPLIFTLVIIVCVCVCVQAKLKHAINEVFVDI